MKRYILLDQNRRPKLVDVPTVADDVGVVPTSLALTAAGSTPNGSSATLAYAAGAYTLTMQPTDGTNPGIISAGNQTLSVAGVVKTFGGQVNHDDIIRLSSTKSIQFNGGSAHAIRYAGNVTTGLQLFGDNFEFNPTSGTGVLYYPEKILGDRYGVIGKDDQSGTPGNFTTVASAGRGAFTAGTKTVVITNNSGGGKAFAVGDDVMVMLRTIDATLTYIARALITAANTLTIDGNANATAATEFFWWVLK